MTNNKQSERNRLCITYKKEYFELKYISFDNYTAIEIIDLDTNERAGVFESDNPSILYFLEELPHEYKVICEHDTDKVIHFQAYLLNEINIAEYDPENSSYTIVYEQLTDFLDLENKTNLCFPTYSFNFNLVQHSKI